MKNSTQVDRKFIEARKIRAKIARINRNRKLSYRMRLAAILATDTRQGQFWA